MKIEDLFVPVEEMQDFVEKHKADIDFSKAAFAWVKTDTGRMTVYRNMYTLCDAKGYEYIIPTFTLEELLELLPKCIDVTDEMGDVVEFNLNINYLYEELSYIDIHGKRCFHSESISKEGAMNMIEELLNNGHKVFIYERT